MQMRMHKPATLASGKSGDSSLTPVTAPWQRPHQPMAASAAQGLPGHRVALAHHAAEDSAAHEQEADELAQKVLATSAAPHAAPHAAAYPAKSPVDTGGQALPANIRQFMEPRFGQDFSHVRVHANSQSEQACSRVQAQAFALDNHIYFGKGHAPGINNLTAHELTHVMQQQHGHARGPAFKLEIRPPSRGIASAFDRKQELIDRLNQVSPGVIEYKLTGNLIEPTIRKEDELSYFDRTMNDFCNDPQTIPLLLAEDKPGNRFSVRGIAAPFVGQKIIGDTFVNGAVDLDDLVKKTDIHAFQSILLHFLTERITVGKTPRAGGGNRTNYNDQLAAGSLFRNEMRSAGTSRFQGIYHAAGHEAQAKHLQDLLGDPSIRYSTENRFVPGKPVSQLFHSKAEGYFVYLEISDKSRVTSARFKVVTADKRRITLEAFLEERKPQPAPVAPL